MIIQIDQSGKIEKTNIPTAVGFTNSKTGTIFITAAEKLKLKRHFRATGKRRAYIYKCFAALIFLLLKDENPLELIIIDTEYPGQEPLIKNHLLNFFRDAGREDINKSSITFKQVGKASRAHEVANSSFKRRRGMVSATAQQVLSLIN